MKRLLSYILPYKVRFVLAILLTVVGTASTVCLPKVVSKITEVIQKGLGKQMDMGMIQRYTVIAFGLILLGALFSYIQSRIMVSVAVGITRTLRRQMGEKENRIPIAYYDRISFGDTLSRLTNDVDAVTDALSNNVITIFTAAMQIAGCFVMMLVTNWILGFCVVISSALGILISRIMAKLSKPRFKAQQKGLGVINSLIEESISGHLVIKAFNCEEDVEAEFGQRNREMYEAVWKSQFFSSLMSPVMQFSGNVSYVVVCVVGAALATAHIAGTTLPVIVSFILYTRMFSAPLTQISHAYRSVMPSFAAAERIFEFLDEEEMTDDPKAKLDTPVQGNVSFSHVRFGYVPNQTIIHDFCAEVKAGQKVAIVGPTGAGKSTMVNLLMRFYELDGGSIRIDGRSISDISREELHSQISMVLQDTWTFEGTIRENVVYSTPGVSDERLNRVIKDVGLSYFVETLPHGLDTVISESSSISSGQKQLLTIARAMIENAPILILDEATSSVDTRLEQIIQDALNKLTDGRTSFVIAHRLSTIKNADVIFVMKDGDVVEVGKHDDLLAKGGLYAELYNSQFEEA